MPHSWMDDYCLRCGREGSRCVCEIELVHGPAYGEHRGSRALDKDFQAALSAPVPEEALREKGVRR